MIGICIYRAEHDEEWPSVAALGNPQRRKLRRKFSGDACGEKSGLEHYRANLEVSAGSFRLQ